MIAEVNGAPPTVIRNDELILRELHAQLQRREYDNIVISPGPGTPTRPSDIGICLEVLQQLEDVPVLGVCLGMQALAVAHGARVGYAPEPVHGRLSTVEHNGHPLFRNVPSGSGSGFNVVRYHSLVVEQASLPPALKPIAWTCGVHSAIDTPNALHCQLPPGAHPPGGTAAAPPAAKGDARGERGLREAEQLGGQEQVLMALAHARRPQYGVQFHPESVGTAYGVALLRNFRDLTAAAAGLALVTGPINLRGPSGTAMPPAAWRSAPHAPLSVAWQVARGALDAAGGSDNIFWQLLGAGDTSNTFWLDSAATDQARFSFMGGPGGPLWQRLSYKLPSLRDAGSCTAPAGHQPAVCGTLTVTDAGGHNVVLHTGLFDHLQRQLATQRCEVSDAASAALPFDFWGGYVGYLGYELKAEVGGSLAHESPLPDAVLFLADRLIAVDHRSGDIYTVALYEAQQPDSAAMARRWVDDTLQRIQELRPSTGKAGTPARSAAVGTPQWPGSSELQAGEGEGEGGGPSVGSGFVLREAREQYLDNVSSCLQALHDGESYELCLTTQLQRPGAVDAAALYRTLRATNPAPYAAWLDCGPGGPILACSSPERFLRGGRGRTLEARPIKGTARRSADAEEDAALAAALACSEKDRAENLMIVDLLRNDMGRVCVPGSVHTAGLMQVESFASVHQLVSTVRGLRREDASVVDCLRAAFPGGSMTGAPKLRSMALLDVLEGGPRGVYSGAIGFLGLNDTFDLNIVIRSAVVTPAGTSIGAGGAVVVQSSPAEEYAEMLLKSERLLGAVAKVVAAGEQGELYSCIDSRGDGCSDSSGDDCSTKSTSTSGMQERDCERERAGGRGAEPDGGTAAQLARMQNSVGQHGMLLPMTASDPGTHFVH